MSSTLAVLEPLLQEFYASTTPNDRKRHIETELLTFKNQPEAWKICLNFLNNTFAYERNQFLWFFCTSTLEHVITRRWMQLNNSDRMLLRENFWNIYVNLNKPANCQRDTIAKLIALLGKRQFPDEDPKYMDHCVLLIKTKFDLGVSLLRTTSEEVVSNRDDISSERKQYFQSCISMFLPDVIELLTKYIVIAVCYINGKDIHSVSDTIIDHNLTTSLPKDNHFNACVLELLTCLQHLTSWIPTDLITELYLWNIFDLAQWRTAHQNISLTTLSVINELLYLQKPLPHAQILMSGVKILLEQHINDKCQGEMYLDKFRELLRSYTIKYWPKMLQDYVTLEAFLKALYLTTIFKNGAYDFTEKLEIWMPIIKGLNAQGKLNRYNEIMDLLVNEIMRRTQFEYNKTELELLDVELLEDNTQTEWQQYLNQCFECIALIAETRPAIVFAQVFHYWNRPQVYLQSIDNDLDYGKNFQVIHEIKCHSFAEHLRDFATVCQAVVRLAPLLNNSDSCTKPNDLNWQLDTLAENLLHSLQFFTSGKLSALDTDKSAFQSDYDNLYAQILMAIYRILPIANIMKSDNLLYRLCDYLNRILQSVTNVASVIYIAASQVILCISSVIRPKFLLNIPAIVNLMRAGPCLPHLPVQALANIYISLISYLVLPLKHYNNEQPDGGSNRCTLLREYVHSLSQSFLELNTRTITDNALQTKVATITMNLLTPFTLVIDAFKDASNTVKEILVTNFKPIITQALIIYNCFGQMNNSIAITVAEFTLSTLRTLQTQLGSQYIKDMITLFITVNSRESSSLRRVSFVEKILQMFQLIVEQPGSASSAMIPAILNFTFEYIMPLLQHDTHITDYTNANYVVYNLFNSILNNKWQYFYKSHMQSNGLELNCTDNLHPEHFMTIMNAYGQALVSANDPNLVHTVLTSMQNVNERWRLYQRPLFKDSLLNSFQNALIKMLLAPEGALHFDLLSSTLFAMSQIDVLKMRENFAQAGLPLNTTLIDEICLTTDIPTFAQKLSQIRQDYHCVHLTQI